MKKIGQGWQYVVYDLENGRVIKIKNNLISQYFRISKNKKSFLKTISNMMRVNKFEKTSNLYIKSILQLLGLEVLGNPKFINESDYEQDKVKVFKDITRENQVSFLNTYPELIYDMWRYGFSEDSFKFDKNIGVDKNGSLVLLDFGEITTNIEDVKKHILYKKWLKMSGYNNLPEEQKLHYEKLMEEKLTISQLEKIWQSKLN